MSGLSVDVFSATGRILTLAKAEIYTQKMLKKSGPNLDGQEIQNTTNRLQSAYSTGNSAFVLWQREGRIYQIIWEQHGLRQEFLRCLFRSWRISKPGIVEGG